MSGPAGEQAPDSAHFERARAQFVAGNAAFEAQRFGEAEACFLASLALLPGRASTLVNLAATRLRLGRIAEAVGPLQEALNAQPDDAQAWLHLGIAQATLGQHAQALQAFDRATSCGAASADLHYRRGLTLVALERRDDALAAWQQALAQDPWLVAAWVDLGSLHRDLGQREQARHCLERALALGADDALLHFQLAALQDEAKAPEAPPREYVQRLFDGYAEGFDQHLVSSLQYRTPQLLADGLGGLGTMHYDFALDLGCGTGLCAAPLQRWVGRLDGVDLSGSMLERARQLGRYDQLDQSDVVEYLQRTERRYALVVAADVFVYLGSLEPVFAGVRRVLQPGGVFAFSVEAADDDAPTATSPAAPVAASRQADDSGFVLRPTLRYAHRETYLRRLAQAHGLEVCATQRHALRRDHGATIVGLCAWMRHGHAPSP